MFQEYQVVFAYIIGIILLYFLGRYLADPMKIVVRLIFNTVLGTVSLLGINLAGSLFNYHIALNPVTALISGILGIPGVLLLVVLKQVYQI
ncbi:MAG TPA: pro-sigmaK processing inhibitor BofA family protein [Acetivibrio sp.]|mgnify:CR=1|jgi:inhibitor of the pro-sigma K processing machinery|nr:pro-sigmaK processing inhibitor BofA family protein [Acetivibrio sp.]HPT90439.1 pro-sigmaK processing inhibitor BofA family protein [Acetivibrio sp.]HQA56537.1 pro-sigmaK processing inhibitor BofA family protein [Acetivibrio sp.]